jgi:hypothetical protein
MKGEEGRLGRRGGNWAGGLLWHDGPKEKKGEEELGRKRGEWRVGLKEKRGRKRESLGWILGLGLELFMIFETHNIKQEQCKSK